DGPDSFPAEHMALPVHVRNSVRLQLTYCTARLVSGLTPTRAGCNANPRSGDAFPTGQKAAGQAATSNSGMEVGMVASRACHCLNKREQGDQPNPESPTSLLLERPISGGSRKERPVEDFLPQALQAAQACHGWCWRGCASRSRV